EPFQVEPFEMRPVRFEIFAAGEINLLRASQIAVPEMKQRHSRLNQPLIKLLSIVLRLGPELFQDLVALEEVLGVEKPQALRVLGGILAWHVLNVTAGAVLCPSVAAWPPAKTPVPVRF